MSTEVVVYLLTALAAVVVVLTRVRLRRDSDSAARAAGRADIARGPVAVHTVAGGLALLTWLTFLLARGHWGEGVVTIIGIVALLLWWVVALAGLLILARWLPTRGKHAADGVEDSWSDGPGLSVLGHLGMVVGVLVFTYAYLVL